MLQRDFGKWNPFFDEIEPEKLENKGKINTESIEKQTEKKDNNGSHEKEINKNSNSSKNGDSENIQYVSKEIPLISEFSKFNQKRNDDYSNILENNPESLFDSIIS